ncbi:MAG: hypothetical protein QOG80_1728 [Pseudonocardiales bacterium]|jgi:hypothetical protein|nr:hypothetical protein [Pseudonocardiales bacterium]
MLGTGPGAPKVARVGGVEGFRLRPPRMQGLVALTDYSAPPNPPIPEPPGGSADPVRQLARGRVLGPTTTHVSFGVGPAEVPWA